MLGVRGRLGGDIFLHGDCVTIGCIPVTDNGIKELYTLAVEARSAGQRQIPIHIFPTRLTPEGMQRLVQAFPHHKDLWDFWATLQEGFTFFEQHRRLPTIRVDKDGRYLMDNADGNSASLPSAGREAVLTTSPILSASTRVID
jgi:murein L,D-transpeptidase YafK